MQFQSATPNERTLISERGRFAIRVPIALWVAMAAVLSTAVFSQRAPTTSTRRSATALEPGEAGAGTFDEEQSEDATLTPELLVDVASRYNEALLANIDALDTALIAIIGVDVAFAVFAIDKIRRLDCQTEWEAITCIIVCAALCLVGYLCGVWGARDGIAPKPLIADYELRGAVAIAKAVDVLGRRGEQNAIIRLVKRILAGFAIVVFVVGGWTVVKPVAIDGAGDRPSPGACKVVK